MSATSFFVSATATSAAAATASAQTAVHHSSNPIGPAIWFALIFVIILNFIFISLRVYCQVFVAREFGRDDAFALAGWAFLNATLIICAAGLKYIRNTSELSVAQMTGRDMSLFAQAVLYNPSYFFLKVSVLLQYLRLLHPGSKRDAMWYACWSIIVFVSVYYLVYLFLEIFQCNPVSASFLPNVPNAKCLDDRYLRIASSSFNSLTDIIMVLIPQRRIWRLQMRRTQKLKASLVFLVALIAVAASIAKLAVNVAATPSNGSARTSILIGVTSYLEMTAILICSCLPYTMILVKRLKKSTGSESKYSSSATLENSRNSHNSHNSRNSRNSSMQPPKHKRSPSDDLEAQPAPAMHSRQKSEGAASMMSGDTLVEPMRSSDIGVAL